MSLPPIINPSFEYTPDKGKASLKVLFTDKSVIYDAIEETGVSPAIDEHGDWPDFIHEE